MQIDGKPAIAIGVGIASGEVIAGYTGTQQRATYTCVGDTVNLAARLEAHTKACGQPVLVDEATMRALEGRLACLLAHHGMIAVGPSLSKAMWLAVEVETLARLLEADSWRPDFLVGIGRGGLVPAAYLSHRTGIQMLSVDHSSGEAGFGDELLEKLALAPRQVLRRLDADLHIHVAPRGGPQHDQLRRARDGAGGGAAHTHAAHAD